MLWQLWKAYQDWKKFKGAYTAVTGSGGYKVMMISNRVDELIRDYARARGDKEVAAIRARMKTIEAELTALIMAVPKDVKPSKDMVSKYAQDVLETLNTSEMARMELQRVYLEQLLEKLPGDAASPWPSRRARLVSGRDAFRKVAVGQLSDAVSVQRDLDALTKYQWELDRVRRDPGVKGDADQLTMIEEDHQKSLESEEYHKKLLRTIHVRAEAFGQAALNLDKLIEAGDLVHKKK
jgi:hypothetical protein